jgi:hemoglobin
VTLTQDQTNSETLYGRVGGYDTIAALVDDLVARMAADPALARFTSGYAQDSRRRRRQLIVDQLSEAAGGPSYYTGRSMKVSHQGLGITETEWNAVVAHFVASMDRCGINKVEAGELLTIFTGTKPDIVEKAP